MGIIQSDILIREAVRAGIKEIRENPNLIDDMLAELLDDELTQDMYGEKTVDQCKKWFQDTQIRVKLGLLVGQADLPCVAIALGNSPEAETVIGDIDWDEPLDVDPSDSNARRSRRGVTANDAYTIACFVHGEPEYCLFLHSIVFFALLRVKDRYLDRRGFMCNSFTNGPFIEAQNTEPGMDRIYQRAITLNGKVRHSVPVSTDQSGKVITQVETNLVPDAVAEPAGKSPATIRSSVKQDLAALMNQDLLAGIR